MTQFETLERSIRPPHCQVSVRYKYGLDQGELNSSASRNEPLAFTAKGDLCIDENSYINRVDFTLLYRPKIHWSLHGLQKSLALLYGRSKVRVQKAWGFIFVGTYQALKAAQRQVLVMSVEVNHATMPKA